jgi:quercetin dioxygenase-like cupin family protein
MAFIDTEELEVFEKGTGGWKGRQFRSPSMTFVHWEFEAGASVHEHSHVQERSGRSLRGRWRSRSGAFLVSRGRERSR